jgi:phosphoribosylformylglycinamidine cyclo-ligase
MEKDEKGAYALSGVDYTKIEPFKQTMIDVGKKTVTFPNKRDVFICEEVMHSHGAVFEYRGYSTHAWCKTQEGLGNLNWIAELMYQYTGKSYYDVIGRAAALLIAIDVIAQGAMPVVWTDEVAAGDSEWFEDKRRGSDYAQGCYDVCKEIGMSLPQGESPSLRYLVKAEPPVKSAPTLSGSITGIIVPRENLITGQKLQEGDIILGVPSSGLHSNGISLVIKRVMPLHDHFLTKLPTGRTLGEECLIPIPSYVSLVETLLQNEVEIHSILPGTGDGIGKLAYDKRPFTYRIENWVDVPFLFLFMHNLGINLENCLKTFNWGIGIYFFVPRHEVESVIILGKSAGYRVVELGRVEEGERKVIFEPEGITLPPPGQ